MRPLKKTVGQSQDWSDELKIMQILDRATATRERLTRDMFETPPLIAQDLLRSKKQPKKEQAEG
jgi:hypothetical protein